MEHTVMADDELIIWWPNGHGYDKYIVRKAEPNDGPAHNILFEGAYGITDKGKVVRL